jgi:hypothetical protein
VHHIARRWPFPEIVNDAAARLVAAGVCVQLVAIAAGWRWVFIPLAFGFVARVSTGPAFSPLAAVASRFAARRFPTARRWPGPPKRFAQGIGATLSLIGLAGWLSGHPLVWIAAAAGLGIGAGLEAIFGICLGCLGFGALMRVGVIPESVCLACADLRLAGSRND